MFSLWHCTLYIISILTIQPTSKAEKGLLKITPFVIIIMMRRLLFAPVILNIELRDIIIIVIIIIIFARRVCAVFTFFEFTFIVHNIMKSSPMVSFDSVINLLEPRRRYGRCGPANGRRARCYRRAGDDRSRAIYSTVEYCVFGETTFSIVWCLSVPNRRRPETV